MKLDLLYEFQPKIKPWSKPHPYGQREAEQRVPPPVEGAPAGRPGRARRIPAGGPLEESDVARPGVHHQPPPRLVGEPGGELGPVPDRRAEELRLLLGEQERADQEAAEHALPLGRAGGLQGGGCGHGAPPDSARGADAAVTRSS